MPWWVPVLTLIAGYVLNMAGDWFKDQRAAEREKSQRLQTVQDRRDEFQRETLKSLQDAIHAERSLVATIGILMRNNYERTKEWSSDFVSKEQAENAINAHTLTIQLGVRVFNDALRAKVIEFREASADIIHAKSVEESKKALDQLTQLMDAINERIGDILRGLY